MKRKILSILLALAMALSLAPGTVLAEDGAVTYPATGGNIYFDNATGTVTDCDEAVTEANIPSEIAGVAVTRIGDSAFADCSSLTSIDIPDGVTSIGDSAFWGCSSLTNIDIPDGVTSIGYLAFRGCRSLTSIDIPDGVTRIGDNAFADCSSLTGITVASGNPAYCSLDGVLFDKEQTGLICYPAKKSGADYRIPDSVTSIGDLAFADCSSLTSIHIPDGVTSIGFGAFEGCSSLTGIDIPDGVTSIKGSAFEGCSSLTGIDIPNGVTSIGDYAFADCSSLTSIHIPDGVISIGHSAFADCSSLIGITVASGNPAYCSLDGVLFDKEQTELICYPAQKSGADYRIPDSVTSIGNYAFADCSSLTSIHIPDGVTSIGHYAFKGCSSLTSIHIPDGVTSIGYGAFVGCSSLASIHIPDGITSIEGSAFWGCSSLTSIDIPDGVTSIGDSAFYGCSSLTSIHIPDSVTSIGFGAFVDCSSLTDVYYGGSEDQWAQITMGENNDPLTSAGIHYGGATPDPDAATYDVTGGKIYFNKATGLITDCDETVTAATIPGGIDKVSVTGIGEGAFSGCAKLAAISIPVGITSVKDSAFSGCASLTDVYYGGSTAQWKQISIGENNAPLTSATIHYNSTGIPATKPVAYRVTGGNLYFDKASGHITSCDKTVTAAVIPSEIDGAAVTGIDSKAFQYCAKLQTLSLPEGIPLLEEYTFYGCSGLASIYIPASVASIGDYAFYNCRHLRDVYYGGSEEQWEQLPIGEENDLLLSADIHCDSTSTPVAPPDYYTVTLNYGSYINAPKPVTYKVKPNARGVARFTFPYNPSSHYEDGKPYYFDGWESSAISGVYAYRDTIDITSDIEFTARWTRSPLGGGSGGGGGVGGGGIVGGTIVTTPPTTPDTPWINPFIDVSINDWFYDEVAYVTERGLMNGMSTGWFDPNGTTTRGQIVTILYRLEGQPLVRGSSFTDVAPGSYCENAVAWAASHDIVNGVGGAKFDPNGSITREQFAAILYRYAKYKGYRMTAGTSLYRYTDADSISGFALEAMGWANAQGLITGVTGNTLAPRGNSTRAQAAAILMRFCENTAK